MNINNESTDIVFYRRPSWIVITVTVNSKTTKSWRIWTESHDFTEENIVVIVHHLSHVQMNYLLLSVGHQQSHCVRKVVLPPVSTEPENFQKVAFSVAPNAIVV